MVQLHLFHATRQQGQHGPGHNEIWIGPFTPKEAKAAEKAHLLVDRELRARGDGPKACKTAIEPWSWNVKEWGERL